MPQILDPTKKFKPAFPRYGGCSLCAVLSVLVVAAGIVGVLLLVAVW